MVSRPAITADISDAGSFLNGIFYKKLCRYHVWLNQARFCFLLPDADALPSQTQVKVDDDRDLGSLSWWEYAVV